MPYLNVRCAEASERAFRSLMARVRELRLAYAPERYSCRMGLDSIELVLEIEDRFGIKIPDAECEKLRTPAALAAAVVARLPRAQGCPTARAFFRLRTLLTTAGGAQRDRVKPGAKLNELLPAPLASGWRAMRSRDPRLPNLVRSERADKAVVWVAGLFVLSLVVVLGVLWSMYGGLIAVSAAVLWGAALVLMMALADRTARRELPAGIATVGDVARLIAVFEIPAEGTAARLAADARVLEEVRRLIAEFLHMPLEKVQPESDLVHDLGID